MTSNQLGQSTSPYLLLHKDNPVHWYPWGKEALDEAEATGKPILLSVGYTACHWCHVMNHESFADPETAALMNSLFVNVKVDREERPDIDQIYQSAASIMGNNGGWPLTIFLTPRGAPFFVGTYFPPVDRAGQVNFKGVLKDVDRIWRDQQDEITVSSARCVGELEQLFNRDMHAPGASVPLDEAAVRIAQRFCIFFGGVTGQSKFPSVTQLENLWRAYLRSGAPQFIQLVSLTLDKILVGGLYDHLGGGFSRYTADEAWQVPHFEKMLYDNAMMLEIMTSVWQFNRNSLCDNRIADTVQFLLRDMMVGDAFAAGIDADSDGEEGKYYLWSEAEIDAALVGTFVQRFKAVYNIIRDGRVNGKNVIQRLGNFQAALPEADEALLARQRQMLLEARGKRNAPMRDDKVLADWNGLAIAALANAGFVFDRADWITAAIKAFDFVVKALGDGDRLHHVWSGGKRGEQAFADDYAQLSRAALQLWETTGDARFLDCAKRWTRTLNTHFWNEQLGGYCFTSDDADPLIIRTRMVFDQPVPSANSTMIGVLTRLTMITSESEYALRADQLIQAFIAEAARAPISCAAYFNNFEIYASGLQIVILGPRNAAGTQALAKAVLGRALPNRLLVIQDPADPFPPGHPMNGKTMQNGQPTAYICQRAAVSAPYTNPVQLSQALQLPPPQPGQPAPQ